MTRALGGQWRKMKQYKWSDFCDWIYQRKMGKWFGDNSTEEGGIMAQSVDILTHFF